MPPKKRKTKNHVFTVDKILAVRKAESGNTLEYLVKWEGFGPEENTWEPEVNIYDRSLIENFNKTQAAQEAQVPMILKPKPGQRRRKASSAISTHQLLLSGKLDEGQDDDTSADFSPKKVQKKVKTSQDEDDVDEVYKRFTKKRMAEKVPLKTITNANTPLDILKSERDTGHVPVAITEGDTTCVVTFSGRDSPRLVSKEDLFAVFPESKKMLKSGKLQWSQERPLNIPVDPTPVEVAQDELISDDDSSFSAHSFAVHI